MDKMAELLKVLAEKAGTAVDQLGPHVVRHTRVSAIVNAGLGAVLLLGAVVIFLVLRHKWATTWQGKTMDDFDSGCPTLIGVCLIVVGTIVGVAFIATSIPAAVEPIGATLKALVGA